MGPLPTKLGGKTVFASGIVIGRKGETIELTPFETQPEYIFKLEIVAIDESENNSSNITKDGPGVSLVHKQQWKPIANEAIVNRTVFGGTEKILYAINYSVRFLGSLDRYSYVFEYTCYNEPIT